MVYYHSKNIFTSYKHLKELYVETRKISKILVYARIIIYTNNLHHKICRIGKRNKFSFIFIAYLCLYVLILFGFL